MNTRVAQARLTVDAYVTVALLSVLPAILTVLSCSRYPPPSVPTIESASAGNTLRLFVVSIVLDGSKISYEISWGDTSDAEWTQEYPSGEDVAVYHEYAARGYYSVQARARSGRGPLSDWAAPLTIGVGLERGAPTNVKLSAATDSSVRVSWTAPTYAVPDRYVVAFMEAGTSTWQIVADSVPATRYNHTPAGRTGKYRVTAMFDTTGLDALTTPSSAPVHTSAMTVSELNGAGNSGFGWDRLAGAGTSYPMTFVSSAASVDFYVTDSTDGSGGAPYAIASPDLGPSDPGGIVPAYTWHASAFSAALSSETAPLPRYSSATYFNYTDIATDPTLVACYTADSHYALVKLTDVNANAATVQVETWFQLIKGLRLIEH
jgi:hypothetical protein